MTAGMTVEPSRYISDAWVAERVDDDGGIEQAIFIGPRAEEMARKYAETEAADWKNDPVLCWGDKCEGNHSSSFASVSRCSKVRAEDCACYRKRMGWRSH